MNPNGKYKITYAVRSQVIGAPGVFMWVTENDKIFTACACPLHVHTFATSNAAWETATKLGPGWQAVSLKPKYRMVLAGYEARIVT